MKKNNYAEYIPVKQAYEQLSDISPKDSRRWLNQFKKLKKMIEYYGNTTTSRLSSKCKNIDNSHNRHFVKVIS